MPINFSGDRATYQLSVGNIGVVYRGPCQVTAESEYDEYVRLSNAGYGRAAGEPVILTRDGEVIKEHAVELA